jgi:SnoaL-like domain
MDIETMLAREEIRDLRHNFSWYLETCNPDALADLFWEEGVIDTGPWGRMEGKEAIRKGYGRAYRNMPQFTALHAVTNSRIVVRGDEGEGTWYLLDHSLREPSSNPLILVALYEERHAKRNELWKYTSLKLTYLWSAEQGRITPENPMRLPESSKKAYREQQPQASR